MKQYVKDMIKNKKGFIVISSTEIESEKAQHVLFELGAKWFYSGKSIQSSLEFGVSSSMQLLARAHREYNTESPKVLASDILENDNFEVGDIVEAFGLRGEVVRTGSVCKPVKVIYDEVEDYDYFTLDGKLQPNHKTPSLTLIERPAKLIKRDFYIWSLNGKVQTELMDDDHKNINGAVRSLTPGDTWKKIEGTRVELDVSAELFADKAGV